MRDSKQCPKCGGTEIYTDDGLTKRGDRCSIPVSSWHKFFLSVYVCKKCGFLEEYIDSEQLKDEKKWEKLSTMWRKL